MKIWKTLAIAAVGLAGVGIAPGANAALVFDNFNGNSVCPYGLPGCPNTAGGLNDPATSPPPVPVTFSLGASTYITQIETYHFTNVNVPGPVGSDTFEIYDSSAALVATLGATLTNPFGPYYNIFVATPDITLSAGTYTFVDTLYSSWSWNFQGSGSLPDCAGINDCTDNGAGFTRITSGPEPVPEPFTLSLFGAGLAGTAALRRRKKIA